MTLTNDHLVNILQYHPYLIGSFECESLWYLPQPMLMDIIMQTNMINIKNLQTPCLFMIILIRPLCGSPHLWWSQLVSSLVIAIQTYFVRSFTLYTNVLQMKSNFCAGFYLSSPLFQVSLFLFNLIHILIFSQKQCLVHLSMYTS